MTQFAPVEDPSIRLLHPNFAVVADLAVREHAAGADFHAVTELHLAGEDHVDVEHDVAAAAYFAADVDPRGIDEGDARAHQLRRAGAAMRRLDLGELPACRSPPGPPLASLR